MFVDAIEKAGQYTRPILMISRNYGSKVAIPGTATLFLVNSDGWALTCRHVAEVLVASIDINKRYADFRKERSAILVGAQSADQLNALEQRYGFNQEQTVQIVASFVDCFDQISDFNIHLHPTYDAALIKFNGFSRIFADDFPLFAAADADLKPGKSICRLGYPFPEFQNFGYDAESDDIAWTAGARSATPRFPMDGMVTRHLGDALGKVYGFEVSTPGLRGQSGGPAFDSKGVVWGMQSATRHLDLNFDVDLEVFRGDRTRRVTNTPFLHVGNCVHVSVLKDFMRSLGVKFKTA
jgi:hypothetical protein